MHTLLIVDDNSLLRKLLADYFSRAGYQVLLASDGREALTRLKEERVDIMLLDLHMPGVHGLDTLRRMRHEVPMASTRVILMSGNYPEIDRHDVEDVSLMVGAHATVYKPFDLPALLNLVREQEALIPYTSPDTFYLPIRSAVLA